MDRGDEVHDVRVVQHLESVAQDLGGFTSFAKMFANILQIFGGLVIGCIKSSKRKFARKYAFDSIFQALQDLHTFAPLQSQNFRKKSVWKISNFRENPAIFLQIMLQNLQNFAKFQNFQLDNLVDFDKC